MDYFLVSSNILDNVEKTFIKPGYRSDHLIVELELNFNSLKRGRGIWKMNNSLLKDEKYINMTKECIKNTKLQYRVNNVLSHEDNPDDFLINSQLLFEVIKLEIRGRTIAYSSALKRSTDKQEKELENQIDSLHQQYIETPTTENMVKLNEANNELKLLREKKVEGIIMRAKAKWKLDGEKNSRYFLNLERKHFQEKV